MSTPTLYEILEVSEDASLPELRAAHRRLMRQLHPDMPTGDPQRAALVNDAWERLSDPADRASYDLMLRYERGRGASETDDEAWGSPETEDAEAWDEPWDDGWGAVSGDEDDAPQDLFDEATDETGPPPGDDESDATDDDAEPGVPGWGAPIEDAPQDAQPAAPPAPDTAVKGVGARQPAPDRSKHDPRRQAGLDAWAQIVGGRQGLSWWGQAEELRRRLPDEPRPGRRKQARQRRVHALLGEEKQGELLLLMLFVCLAGLAAMNAMLMGEIGPGILTGLAVGMVAVCVAILVEVSLKFMFSDITKHPRSAAMLRALPLLVLMPAGFDAVAILPARGALVAIQQLSDPTLPHPWLLSLAVLAVYISYLLIVWIFPNLGNEYIPANFDSPAVEAAPGEFPLWASDLMPVERFIQHRQWGEPARGLSIDAKGRAQALTSQLLDEIARIPYVRIVHNLRPDPGFEPFVDHAVLCGRLLLVVESHYLPGGPWSYGADGLRAHGPGGFLIQLDAARAAHRMRCRFRRLTVRALVVVHTADGKPVQLTAGESSEGVQVLTAAEFAETVGQLCVQQDGRPAGRRPFSELVHLMD